MDTRTPEQRHRIMQSVRSKNTEPEMFVRRLLFRLGYRYRIHQKHLPGTPDIVFAGRRKAIFVHGCYWHGHCCKKGQLPKSRKTYWSEKIAKNRERDSRKQAELHALGWMTLTIWQCELVEPSALEERLRLFLGDRKFRSTSG